jgi:flagellar biosynthetic protein FlhB
MADDEQSSRTEEPTSRRLQQGRERGQVAQSQDVRTWAVLAGATLALAFFAQGAGERLVRNCLRFLDHPERIDIGMAQGQAGLARVLLDVGWVLAPILLLLAVLGAGSALAQSGLIWAPSRIQPELGKLSPAKGLQRIASLNALTEFIKGLLKLGLVAAVTTALLMPTVAALETWSAASLTATVNYAMRLLVRLSGAVAALMTVLAILDYVYQRFSFMKQMRMTKQELHDELKQSDGDPVIKSRIRRLRQERAKKRMMAAVPGAAVVITNPTHYAVALAYEMETMPAPKVVAKGVDVLARRIREVAEANGVPIVENPPLARALHGSVEVDDEIPAEHYQAVAQVIGFVMRARQGGQTTQRRTSTA